MSELNTLMFLFDYYYYYCCCVSRRTILLFLGNLTVRNQKEWMCLQTTHSLPVQCRIIKSIAPLLISRASKPLHKVSSPDAQSPCPPIPWLLAAGDEGDHTFLLQSGDCHAATPSKQMLTSTPQAERPCKRISHTYSKMSAQVPWQKWFIWANTCLSVLLPSCTSGSSFHLRTGCLAKSHLPAPGGLLAWGTPRHLLSLCHHLQVNRHTREFDSTGTSGSNSWVAQWAGRHFPLRKHCRPQAINVFNQTATSSKIFWKIKLKSRWLIN